MMQADSITWVVAFNMWDKRQLIDAFGHRTTWRDEITRNWSSVDEHDCDRVMASLRAITIDDLAEILEIAKRENFGDGGTCLYAEASFAMGRATSALCSAGSGFKAASADMHLIKSGAAKAAMSRISIEIESKVRELHSLALASIREKGGE